jgi:hypothetical protein
MKEKIKMQFAREKESEERIILMASARAAAHYEISLLIHFSENSIFAARLK